MQGIDSPTMVEIESGAAGDGRNTLHMSTPTRTTKTNTLFGSRNQEHTNNNLRDVAVVHPLSMTAEFKEVVCSVV